jgi:hypothetical protein
MSESGFCPYVGLQPFTEAYRDYFFGRERDVRLIAANLQATKLTILYGPSGVGKSSVLMAGAMPILRSRPHTAAAIFREWQRIDARQELKRTVADATGTAAAPIEWNSAEPLDELLKRSAERLGGRLILILDQFEEYFVYQPEWANGGFDAELARAVNRPDVDAALMFSLREDALSKLDRFRARIHNLLSNSLRLEYLDTASARLAINKPLERYNALRPEAAGASVSADANLVDAVIQQVQSGQVRLGQGTGTGESAIGVEQGRIETPFLNSCLRVCGRKRFQTVRACFVCKRCGGSAGQSRSCGCTSTQ